MAQCRQCSQHRVDPGSRGISPLKWHTRKGPNVASKQAKGIPKHSQNVHSTKQRRFGQSSSRNEAQHDLGSLETRPCPSRENLPKNRKWGFYRGPSPLSLCLSLLVDCDREDPKEVYLAREEREERRHGNPARVARSG